MRFVTKYLYNTKIKRFFIIFLLLILYIFFCAISYTNAICTNISDSVFRLHVIANSDTPEDQNLKYIVRDSIIDYINEITKNAESKEEVIELARNNIDEIKKIAEQTVYNEGYNYKIEVSIGNFEFPTKKYGDITLPPGFYDALKIEIGNAEGQNWWCVMFPPLCFVDITSGIVPDDSKEIMQNSMSEDEYELISENTRGVKFKFKIVEVLQNFTISGIFM